MKAGRPIIAFGCGRFTAARIYGVIEKVSLKMFDNLQYELFRDFLFPLTSAYWSLLSRQNAIQLFCHSKRTLGRKGASGVGGAAIRNFRILNSMIELTGVQGPAEKSLRLS
jgi:hypothetical protein